jgi:hypothetical protein
VAIVAGVVVFSLTKTVDQTVLEPVVIWGTLPSVTVNSFLIAVKEKEVEGSSADITYVYIPEENFENEFLEALAVGSGPDLVLLPHEDILKQRNKLFVIPYESLPARTFKDMFIQAGELFLVKEGTLAIPFSIDPIGIELLLQMLV